MAAGLISDMARQVMKVPALWAFPCAFACLAPGAALADRYENEVAVFAALDKVTAAISALKTPLGETKSFGALRVTARVCYARPPTEPPKTTAFVEVDEFGLDGQARRIFTGWMFAESPGLNAVEHPVFDIWLTGCEQPKKSLARRSRPPSGEDDALNQDAPPDDPLETPRRRVRR